MPVEYFVVVLLRDKLFHYLFAPPCRYNHEHIPGGGAEFFRQFVDIRDLFLVPLCERRVDNEFYPVFFEQPCGIDCPLKRALLASKVVMDRRVSAVETERDDPDT
jgi:hypothetical protein